MGARNIKNVLTIAGVDPSGGAGVLADVKVMSALGTFATGVIAALTAQNTRAVTGVMPVPAAFVKEQIDTLFADVRIDAVKIGMLGAQDVMAAVAQALRAHQAPKVVLDTVMVAKSGDRLMPDESVDYFRQHLLPLADLITPNLPEAAVLLGKTEIRAQDMKQAACELFDLCAGRSAVYLKGGHLQGEKSCDVLYDGKKFVEYDALRVQTKNTHGTGCSLSSALAACLARTNNLEQAALMAKNYISEAIAASSALEVGSGHGPIHHFVRLWQADNER